MKITFEQLLKDKEWLHSELMNSLPHHIITKAKDDRYLEVKLLVNGEEIEPKLFNKLLNNVDAYIHIRAKEYVTDNLQEAEYKIDKLNDLIREASNKIKDEFDLHIDYNDED